ncbi:hypothetical protein QQF64_019581 [Cirrhinus molitorella]|uniref:Uncharacterized protein n=1 Tax=Cirrhinus molitorella TaxID=172907 RepID=A0ABR3LHF8_9TELE
MVCVFFLCFRWDPLFMSGPKLLLDDYRSWIRSPVSATRSSGTTGVFPDVGLPVHYCSPRACWSPYADSGLYQLTIVGDETKYQKFTVKVYQYPRSTSLPESSSSSNCVTSSFVANNSTVNQIENNNNTELHQPSSDNIHCCGSVETVIRLALSALVSVATVAVLVYDIRSTRHELIRAEQTKHFISTV